MSDYVGIIALGFLYLFAVVCCWLFHHFGKNDNSKSNTNGFY